MSRCATAALSHSWASTYSLKWRQVLSRRQASCLSPRRYLGERSVRPGLGGGRHCHGWRGFRAMRGLVDSTAREFGGWMPSHRRRRSVGAEHRPLLLIEAWIATSSQRRGASADTPTAGRVHRTDALAADRSAAFHMWGLVDSPPTCTFRALSRIARRT